LIKYIDELLYINNLLFQLKLIVKLRQNIFLMWLLAIGVCLVYNLKQKFVDERLVMNTLFKRELVVGEN